jgi:hypothetical protein
MPPGRAWGATSAVYPAPDGKHIWVAERCEANTCVGKVADGNVYGAEVGPRALKKYVKK